MSVDSHAKTLADLAMNRVAQFNDVGFLIQ